ncbi:hypothetical protein [Azohydromonas caseinilytica]|uniref:Uncharacterized protein n=1 Tax=Azohydromonas caseinilytica TaxID=2728836 RepID=A0A848FCS7_9BURK|nr:hypothetical protein [Azohydromonas caseinilytica]NML15970.1 hypothetical protein [Azohydromonas caseinilytica]
MEKRREVGSTSKGLRAGALALCGLMVAFGAAAANRPCSGAKGGVARCDGARFVCNDGSYSASKKVCSANAGSGATPYAGDGGGSSPRRRGGRRR